MVYMLWRECIPAEFYKYICNEQNFIYLNGKDIKQAGVLEIVGNFINQGKEQLRILQEYLSRYKDIYNMFILMFFLIFILIQRKEILI